MREFDIQLKCSTKIKVAQIAGMCQPVSSRVTSGAGAAIW
jgi:hypothetical protein